jgi:hypothetical protein
MCITGCGLGSWKEIHPLGNGYSKVYHFTRSWIGEETGGHIELQYTDPNGSKRMLCGAVNDVFIKGNMAVFADMNFDLFVFEPPGPSVDITVPLAKRAEEEYHWGIRAQPGIIAVPKLIERSDGVQIWVAVPAGNGTTNMFATWSDLELMAQEAKAEKPGGDGMPHP